VAVCTAGQVLAQSGQAPGLLDLTPRSATPLPASNSTPAPTPAKDATAGTQEKTVKPAAKEAPAESLLSGIVDPNVIQASCPNCGGGGLFRGDAGCGPAGCPSIGCNGCNCVPGRTHCCSICDSDTVAGRIFCGLYECICCPDHCYEPEYVPAANASFFADSARPVTQTRLRYDGLFDITAADRAEYYFPHFNLGKAVVSGGGPCGTATTGKGPPFVPSSVDLHIVSLYQEAAVGRFSVFVSMPYEHYEPDESVADLALGKFVCPHSGFGDISIGTKSLLLDCDLLQIAFQFTTILPSGNFTEGLGTGHVSLEPALLFTVKLTPDMYFQGEMAYWIPIGGDALYEGPVWHNRFSLNQVLTRILPDVQIIGTLECINYNVLGGNFTSPDVVIAGSPVAVSATSSMFSFGPGIRLDICRRFDIGVGSQFNVTSSHFADEAIRVEMRLRF
jgi:hypothetical protein